MAKSAHITHTSRHHPAFADAVPVPTPDLTAETVAMLAALSADTPERKRNGRIVGLVVRHIPRLGDAGLGLSPALV